ncbi:hypothetical protein ACFLZV_04000 [Candidatus Margulisiibacteriota bacterium]
MVTSPVGDTNVKKLKPEGSSNEIGKPAPKETTTDVSVSLSVAPKTFRDKRPAPILITKEHAKGSDPKDRITSPRIFWPRALSGIEDIDTSKIEKSPGFNRSICDAVAGSIMSFALGGEENYFSIVNEANSSLASKTANTNLANFKLFTGKDKGTEFENSLKDWMSNTKEPSQIQLKFQSDQSYHTFVIQKEGPDSFQVFQGYQGLYTVDEFLSGNPSDTNPKGGARPDGEKDKLSTFFSAIGTKKLSSNDAFFTNLKNAMKGSITKSQYKSMFGALPGEKHKDVSFHTMGMITTHPTTSEPKEGGPYDKSPKLLDIMPETN